MFTQLVKNPLTLAATVMDRSPKNGSNILLIFLSEVTARAVDGNQYSTPCHCPAATNQRPQTRNEVEVSEAAEIWMKERRQRSSLSHSLVLAKTISSRLL